MHPLLGGGHGPLLSRLRYANHRPEQQYIIRTVKFCCLEVYTTHKYNLYKNLGERIRSERCRDKNVFEEHYKIGLGLVRRMM